MNALTADVSRPPANYRSIEALPEHLTGELLDGELFVQPRPSGAHALASVWLASDLANPFGKRGGGGPGGWWILPEPELHLAHHVLVPDLAGWRRERMPSPPLDHRFTVVPDWVCEILSPSTARKDRVLKMRIYAQLGVPFCWLLDPLARTLEVLALQGNSLWRLEATFVDAEPVRAVPFDAVELSMTEWWVPETATADDVKPG